MTKYEWESELKKRISGLPDDEIRRVLEYYGELFEDKAERGMSERDIINEFGNPVDVADKIMSDYDGPLKSDDPFDVPPRVATPNMRRGGADTQERDIFDDRRTASVNADTVGGSVAVKDNDDENNKRYIRLSAFLIINVVTCFTPIILSLVLWIVLGALGIAGVGIAIGGAAACVVAFGTMFTGMFGTGMAHLGIGLALFGIGLLLAIASSKCIKAYSVFFLKCCGLLIGGKK